MKLHHINIRAPRELLEEEKTFFCKVLGLQQGKRPNFSTNGFWLYADDKAIVHLTESDTHFKNERQGFFDHVAFQTTNLKQLIQRLEEMKIEYSSAYLSEMKTTQIFLKAPSNTGIELNFKNEKI